MTATNRKRGSVRRVSPSLCNLRPATIRRSSITEIRHSSSDLWQFSSVSGVRRRWQGSSNPSSRNDQTRRCCIVCGSRRGWCSSPASGNRHNRSRARGPRCGWRSSGHAIGARHPAFAVRRHFYRGTGCGSGVRSLARATSRFLLQGFDAARNFGSTALCALSSHARRHARSPRVRHVETLSDARARSRSERPDSWSALANWAECVARSNPNDQPVEIASKRPADDVKRKASESSQWPLALQTEHFGCPRARRARADLASVSERSVSRLLSSRANGLPTNGRSVTRRTSSCVMPRPLVRRRSRRFALLAAIENERGGTTVRNFLFFPARIAIGEELRPGGDHIRSDGRRPDSASRGLGFGRTRHSRCCIAIAPAAFGTSNPPLRVEKVSRK